MVSVERLDTYRDTYLQSQLECLGIACEDVQT